MTPKLHPVERPIQHPMKHIRKKQKLNRWIAGSAGAAALLSLPSHAVAQSADAIINKLVQKGVLTQDKAKDLKKDSDQDFSKSFFSQAGMPAWAKSVPFPGYLGLRLDGPMFENSLNKPDRFRYRYRLR